MMAKIKSVLMCMILLLSSRVYSLVGEVLDRVYDFSERVVLVNTTDSFHFEHCKLNKCDRITIALPRDLNIEEFVGEQKRLGLVANPEGQQAMFDALVHYKRYPEKYEMVVFGKSIQPEKFNVFCSDPEITKILKKTDSSANANWLYRFRGEANKGCRTFGQEETSGISFAEYIRIIKETAQTYDSARQHLGR
jgi:hypothetical protein